MDSSLFKAFAQMMEALPPKAVFRAVGLEREMLQNDLLRQRPLPVEDAVSILNFCRFIEAVTLKLSLNLRPAAVPQDHIPFYRKIVARLIQAGELPDLAEQLFDWVFFPGFPGELAT